MGARWVFGLVYSVVGRMYSVCGRGVVSVSVLGFRAFGLRGLWVFAVLGLLSFALGLRRLV